MATSVRGGAVGAASVGRWSSTCTDVPDGRPDAVLAGRRLDVHEGRLWVNGVSPRLERPAVRAGDGSDALICADSALAKCAQSGHYALSMGHADDIWNRACAEAGQPKTLTAPGDRSLADMVLTHSLAMTGGLLHAVQSCTPDEVAAAVRGYRFFGLESAAAVLEDVARSWGDGDRDDRIVTGRLS